MIGDFNWTKADFFENRPTLCVKQKFYQNMADKNIYERIGQKVNIKLHQFLFPEH